MKYAVHSIIKTSYGTKQDIMITNVEAKSACAAEHKILDSFYTGIDNATAYDMDNIKEMEYAARYFNGSKVYDYKEFRIKALVREEAIQNEIDRQLDDIKEFEDENKKLTEEIYELQARMEQMKRMIKTNKEVISDIHAELNEFCKNIGARAQHSEEEIIGIA